METKELDEKGFVFIIEGRPYWCRIYYKAPWIMYWNKSQKSWVTFRKVNQTEISHLVKHKIPDWQADVYHKMDTEWEDSLPDILKTNKK